MTSVDLLLMQQVCKRFGASRALRGVDLAVRRGEVHALVGENGAGKSTLMKVLSGAHAPDSGGMTLKGKPFAPASPLEALESGIAMIYQEQNLAPHLSIEKNVMLGREPARCGWIRTAERRKSARQALELLDHADLDLRQRVSDLGPGAKQIVELARALACNAEILVMDEPTSSLSAKDTERLFQVIKRLCARGVSIIYISHFLEEVKRIADRYTVLRDGETVASGEVSATAISAIIEQMIGRRLDEMFPVLPRTPGEVILAVRELSGSRLPLQASFELRRGEILGLAGLVGAGRTELLRALFGLDPVRGGHVRVAAFEGMHSNPAERLHQGMGLLSENRKEEGLLLNRSIAENVTLSRMQPFARVRWIPGWIHRGKRDAATTKWMEALSIKAVSCSQKAGELSGGNQQKVALARLLHHDVDVLLLDEPTRGVDVGSKAEIYRFIQERAREGKAVVMVSSYVPELLGVCDRVAVMHRGRLGAARAVKDWSESEVLKHATQGAANA